MMLHHDKPDTRKLPKFPGRKSRRIGAVIVAASAALATGELAGCSSSTDAQLAPVATVTVTVPGNNGDLTKRVDVPEDRVERARWLADRVLDGLLQFENKAGGGTDSYSPMYPGTLAVDPPKQKLATNGRPSDISFAMVDDNGKSPDGKYEIKITSHDGYACYKKVGKSIIPSRNPDADCRTAPESDDMSITIVSPRPPDVSSTDGLVGSLKGDSKVVGVVRNGKTVPLDVDSAIGIVEEVIKH